jgi:hypothetical protein
MAYEDELKRDQGGQIGRPGMGLNYVGDTRRPMTDEEKVSDLFTYHPPREEQVLKYVAVRDAAKHLAMVILHHVPAGADRTAAIRLLRECVMTSNAAIALDGRSL